MFDLTPQPSAHLNCHRSHDHLKSVNLFDPRHQNCKVSALWWLAWWWWPQFSLWILGSPSSFGAYCCATIEASTFYWLLTKYHRPTLSSHSSPSSQQSYHFDLQSDPQHRYLREVLISTDWLSHHQKLSLAVSHQISLEATHQQNSFSSFKPWLWFRQLFQDARLDRSQVAWSLNEDF